jgi:signal transduction histidine kinase
MYGQHQAALAELTQSVLTNSELPIFMRQVVTLVARTLAVAYSAIWELLPDGGSLVLRAGNGWRGAAAEGTTLAVAADCPIGSTVLGTTPTIVTDWLDETRFSMPTMLRDHGVISSLCVVIPSQGQPFGSLGVAVTASRMFSNEESAFLQAVANVLALAIERAAANQVIEQQLEARTREIERQLVAAAQDRAVLEERQRLARDLHDSVTQSLYSVTLHAEAATRLLAAGDVTTTATYLHELRDTAQEALDEMRLLIFELRPPVLEQVGLVAALQARLNAVEGRANLETRMIVNEVGDLPSAVEQALYRIAQEALNNALKHASAHRITVQLLRAQSRVTLEIDDDGAGFDSSVARENGGLGLRGIAERVAQLKGILTIHSAPGAGTQLCVEIAV